MLHVRVRFVLVLSSMDTLRCAQERHLHLCASSAQETGDEANCASGSHTSLWHTRPQAVQHYTKIRGAFLNTKGGSQNVDLMQRLFSTTATVNSGPYSCNAISVTLRSHSNKQIGFQELVPCRFEITRDECIAKVGSFGLPSFDVCDPRVLQERP